MVREADDDHSSLRGFLPLPACRQGCNQAAQKMIEYLQQLELSRMRAAGRSQEAFGSCVAYFRSAACPTVLPLMNRSIAEGIFLLKSDQISPPVQLSAPKSSVRAAADAHHSLNPPGSDT